MLYAHAAAENKYKKCCGSCRHNLPREPETEPKEVSNMHPKSTMSKGNLESTAKYVMGGDDWDLQQIMESNPTAVQSQNVLLALFHDKLKGGDMPQDLDNILRTCAQYGCGRSNRRQQVPRSMHQPHCSGKTSAATERLDCLREERAGCGIWRARHDRQ